MVAVRLSIVLLCSSMALEAAQTEPVWTHAGIKNGVLLAFRDDQKLNAREVRAVVELPHPASRIIPIVCDFTQTLDPDVSDARILSGEIGGRYEIYLRYASRYFIVSARDVVLDVRPAAHGCAWSEVVGSMPPQRGAVRVQVLRGSWSVEPIDTSRSRLTYQVAVRPGGRIPGWMVRRGAVIAMPDVIEQVARCLSSPARRDGRCPKPS